LKNNMGFYRIKTAHSVGQFFLKHIIKFFLRCCMPIHANVPDNAFDGLDSGWYKMYWEPFKLFLAGIPVSKASM